MSENDQPHEPVAADPVVVDSGSGKPRRPKPANPASRPRGGGSRALALLLSLIAVMMSGYVGWRQWQQARSSVADDQTLVTLQQRVQNLETTLTGVSDGRASLNQRLNDADQVNRSLREQLLDQAERTRHLEDAVARLAEKSRSGHDAMLLDETESLLRMGAERYTLFHDAQGAAAAYALADQTLAAVNDGIYSGVRQNIEDERTALMKSQPLSQASALQRLSELRAAMATLPLKPLDRPGNAESGMWSRIGRALAGVIKVQRDHGTSLTPDDARLTRELLSLDLAQAQAALLARDSQAYAAALQQAQAGLAAGFDDRATAVQAAQATLKQLPAALPPNASVHLGAALSELRNLRALHALKPAAGSVPAPAATAAHPATAGGVRR
ncbi:MAG: hypothetical protein EPN74_00370 [Rhodanobacter sp.]|nr:MAG: hypothetical protein EPN74_00370 [Rhodanobacter sp.]